MDKMKTLKIGCGIILLFCLFLVFSLLYDDNTKNLGSGFKYDTNRKDILGKIDIPPTIISFDYDKHFIIAKQRPTEFHHAIYDKMDYIYPLGRDTIYYWLIIKQEQKILGPLDSIQFLEHKKKCNIPDKLILQ